MLMILTAEQGKELALVRPSSPPSVTTIIFDVLSGEAGKAHQSLNNYPREENISK